MEPADCRSALSSAAPRQILPAWALKALPPQLIDKLNAIPSAAPHPGSSTPQLSSPSALSAVSAPSALGSDAPQLLSASAPEPLRVAAALPDLAVLALPPRFSAELCALMGSTRNQLGFAAGVLAGPLMATHALAGYMGIDLTPESMGLTVNDPRMNPTASAARMDNLKLAVIKAPRPAIKDRETEATDTEDSEGHVLAADSEDITGNEDHNSLSGTQGRGSEDSGDDASGTQSFGSHKSLGVDVPAAQRSQGAEEPMCAVCQTDFQEGEIGFVVNGCGHPFHVKCLNPWLSRSDSCPCCRRKLVSVTVSNERTSRANPSGPDTQPAVDSSFGLRTGWAEGLRGWGSVQPDSSQAVLTQTRQPNQANEAIQIENPPQEVINLVGGDTQPSGLASMVDETDILFLSSNPQDYTSSAGESRAKEVGPVLRATSSEEFRAKEVREYGVDGSKVEGFKALSEEESRGSECWECRDFREFIETRTGEFRDRGVSSAAKTRGPDYNYCGEAADYGTTYSETFKAQVMASDSEMVKSKACDSVADSAPADLCL